MTSFCKYFLILGFAATQALALPVPEETARTVAVNWYTHYAPVDITPSDITIEQQYTFASGSMTDYYLCTFIPAGFVIVSGDDAAIPVIGYSHRSPVQVELTHPTLQEFFNSVREQLQWIRSERIDNSSMLQLWQEIVEDNLPPPERERNVTPLLSTTWHQNCGYNDDCPIDGDGPCGHAYAGCVATAMAQVMNYWEHPERGSGAHGYMHPDYGYLFVNYYDAVYDWGNMPDHQSNADIAELLYHCGVALEMEYGPDGSGAAAGDYDYPSVVSALPDYFDYKSDIDFFWRAQFTPYGWRTLLEGQLDNGRPVIYRGTGEVGHAFVCDGYQGVEYYHFNWGWSGNFDGYYYLYSLAPGDHDFYFDHGAVVNIRPDVPLTPGEIEDLKLTLSGDDVTLEWTAIEGADGYSVYRSVIPYGQSGVLLETITGNMITLTDELQFYSEAYYYVTVVYDGEVSDMTLIPAGTFLMGSSDGDYWEQPIHQVTLTNDFYLGTHEVTNEEYRFALQWAYDNDHLTATENTVQAHGEELLDLDSQNCEISFSAGTFRLIMRTHSLEDGTQGPGVAYPSGYSPLNHPVKEVSWFGAACYCDWLSMMDGFDAFYDGNWDQTEEHNPYISPSYRLPTEAEREYAASFNDSRIYPWGDEPPIPCEQANHELCIGWTSPVGSFPLGNSQLGLQDIAGNLWEWTGDWYDSDYYDFNPITDPLGPVDGSYRVQRGASWHNLGIYLRCADRSYNWPFITTNFIGFRIAQRVNEMHIMRGK